MKVIKKIKLSKKKDVLSKTPWVLHHILWRRCEPIIAKTVTTIIVNSDLWTLNAAWRLLVGVTTGQRIDVAATSSTRQDFAHFVQVQIMYVAFCRIFPVGRITHVRYVYKMAYILLPTIVRWGSVLWGIESNVFISMMKDILHMRITLRKHCRVRPFPL